MTVPAAFQREVETLRAALAGRLPDLTRHVPGVLPAQISVPRGRGPALAVLAAAAGLAGLALALAARHRASARHVPSRETIARWEDEGGTVFDDDALADMRPRAAAELADPAPPGLGARGAGAVHAAEHAMMASAGKGADLARRHPALALTLTAGAGAALVAALLRRRS